MVYLQGRGVGPNAIEEIHENGQLMGLSIDVGVGSWYVGQSSADQRLHKRCMDRHGDPETPPECVAVILMNIMDNDNDNVKMLDSTEMGLAVLLAHRMELMHQNRLLNKKMRGKIFCFTC
jgi:hypothetical protein